MRETKAGAGAGALFWILGVVFLLWNAAGGCGIYLLDKSMTDAELLKLSGQAALDARHAYPIWASIAYAIAVWVGLLAAILYLLRKRLSVTLFILSLSAAIICFIPNFTNATVKAGGGDSFWVMPVIVVIIGCLEIWWSRRKVADGTLS